MHSHTLLQKIIRRILGTLLVLLALNAIGGGFYGIAGARGIPIEWLDGSPFQSYFIPGIILLLCVGGSSAFAAIAVFKKYVIANKASSFAGLITLGWLVTQIHIIGYVSSLQPVIAIATLTIIFLTWKLAEYDS